MPCHSARPLLLIILMLILAGCGKSPSNQTAASDNKAGTGEMPNVVATDMPAEGKKYCSACHSVEGKKMAPGFTDVSKKYKDDKDAASKIAASITKGGAFGWNMGMMPAKGMGASDADIKVMAEFIAGLSHR